MSANPIFRMVTANEFASIPNPSGGRYELHHGEVVFVTFPKPKHKRIQRRLQALLATVLAPNGYLVDVEYPYRPQPNYEAWSADVACLAAARDQDLEDWLEGSPEIVIEVRSPSNTRRELEDKARTTLAGNGGVEFWIVDPQKLTIEVFSRSGSVVWEQGDILPISLVEGAHLSVNSVFEAGATVNP